MEAAPESIDRYRFVQSRKASLLAGLEPREAVHVQRISLALLMALTVISGTGLAGGDYRDCRAAARASGLPNWRAVHRHDLQDQNLGRERRRGRQPGRLTHPASAGWAQEGCIDIDDYFDTNGLGLTNTCIVEFTVLKQAAARPCGRATAGSGRELGLRNHSRI